MRCIIIEDQPPAQRILKKYIEDIGTLELQEVFTDALAALAFLQQQRVELIFLDIHLPKISGIDFLKTLPDPPHVILTTAFSEYALESYEFNVVDYLLKPFSFQRFVKAVAKVPKPITNAQGGQVAAPVARKEIFIKSGYEHIRIVVEEIRFIKVDTDYTEIVLPEKKYLSADTLRRWRERLAEDQFVQIHKSYLVNTRHIVKVAGNQVHLDTGVAIPIGRAYKEDFMRNFIA